MRDKNWSYHNGHTDHNFKFNQEWSINKSIQSTRSTKISKTIKDWQRHLKEINEEKCCDFNWYQFPVDRNQWWMIHLVQQYWLLSILAINTNQWNNFCEFDGYWLLISMSDSYRLISTDSQCRLLSKGHIHIPTVEVELDYITGSCKGNLSFKSKYVVKPITTSTLITNPHSADSGHLERSQGCPLNRGFAV